MLVFSKDKPHTICLCALGYSHIHTLGHEMNFPTAAFLISPGVTCSFVRRGETACGVNFVLRLDVLKSARLIHGFRADSYLELQI